MPDARLHRRPALHPAPETFGRPASAAFVHVNLNLACVAMTTITHIDKHMLRRTGNPLNLLDRIL